MIHRIAKQLERRSLERAKKNGVKEDVELTPKEKENVEKEIKAKFVYAQFYKRMHPEIAYKIIRFQRDRSLKPSVSKLAKALIGFRSAINILAGYRNFGLMEDDLELDYEVVQWASTRLPLSVQEARTDRLYKALVYNSHHTIAPEDQWVKPVDDYPYLQPYLQEVKEEITARRRFRSRLPNKALFPYIG